MQSEGYPLKVTKSALLCTSGNKFITFLLGTKNYSQNLCHYLFSGISGSQESSNVTWDIQTPANLVPDTDHIYISLNGDLLGNTIEVVIIKFACSQVGKSFLITEFGELT